MNVVPAWKKGITGKNVVITILDDGKFFSVYIIIIIMLSILMNNELFYFLKRSTTYINNYFVQCFSGHGKE